MPEMLDAIAKLDEQGNPRLGTCTLVLGDGTTKVRFQNGRAKVTPQQAAMLAKRGDVDVFGLGAALGTEVSPAPAEPVEETREPQQSPEPQQPPEPEPTAPELTPEEAEAKRQADEAAIEAAKQHLKEEGLEVPTEEEPKAIPLPEGFELKTAEGEDRCLAAKGDGSQCANAAKADRACGLAKHRESVAALLAA